MPKKAGKKAPKKEKVQEEPVQKKEDPEPQPSSPIVERAPEVPGAITDAWHKCERTAPELLLSNLNPPATDQQIIMIERKFNCKLHPDVLEYLKVHNGCKTFEFNHMRWQEGAHPFLTILGVEQWEHFTEDYDCYGGDLAEEASAGRCLATVYAYDNEELSVHINLLNGKVYLLAGNDGNMYKSLTLLQVLKKATCSAYSKAAKVYEELFGNLGDPKYYVNKPNFEQSHNFQVINIKEKTTIPQILQEKGVNNDVFPHNVYRQLRQEALIHPAIGVAIQAKKDLSVCSGIYAHMELGMQDGAARKIDPSRYPDWSIFVQCTPGEGKYELIADDVILFRTTESKMHKDWQKRLEKINDMLKEKRDEHAIKALDRTVEMLANDVVVLQSKINNQNDEDEEPNPKKRKQK